MPLGVTEGRRPGVAVEVVAGTGVSADRLEHRRVAAGRRLAARGTAPGTPADRDRHAHRGADSRGAPGCVRMFLGSNMVSAAASVRAPATVAHRRQRPHRRGLRSGWRAAGGGATATPVDCGSSLPPWQLATVR